MVINIILLSRDDVIKVINISTNTGETEPGEM